MRDDRERLRDVLEAIERIEKYAVRGREALKDVGSICVHPCSSAANKTLENSRPKPPPQYMLMPTGEQDFFDLTETALWICT